jgi:hypothetical protein
VRSQADRIRKVAAEVQAFLDDVFAHTPAAAIAGTALDQRGLRDGLAIIDDHLRAGDNGAAFDHLLYMLMETSATLTPASTRAIEQLTRELARPAPSASG